MYSYIRILAYVDANTYIYVYTCILIGTAALRRQRSQEEWTCKACTIVNGDIIYMHMYSRVLTFFYLFTHSFTHTLTYVHLLSCISDEL